MINDLKLMKTEHRNTHILLIPSEFFLKKPIKKFTKRYLPIPQT